MRNTTTRNIIFTALCIAIGLLLPQLVKFVPVAYSGAVLLPMHIPVLVCGFLCGWRFGAVSGIVTPMLASLLTGMPPLFPNAVSMMFELAAYGLLTGLLYKLTNRKIFLTLIGAMLGGRIVLGLVNALLFSIADNVYGLAIFISGAFITALPGIIIQLILVPIIIRSLERAKLIL